MTTQVADQDLELLSRYIDGELPAAESRRLEARLHAEQDLQKTLVLLQELNQRLRDSLNENAAVPDATARLLEPASAEATADEAVAAGASNVVLFPGSADAAPQPRRAAWPVAIAASFVAATALTLVFNASTDREPTLPGNDAFVSAALDSEPSGTAWIGIGDGRELKSVLTFPHVDGRWCREYLLRGGDSDWRAVACRDETRWVTQAAGLESYLEPAGAYRPAGAGDAGTVAVFISQHAADIALDLDEEIALINRDWQR